MSDFKLKEYAQRSETFTTQVDDYKYLLQLNRKLQTLESAEYRDVPEGQPFVFIFGVPRSGTTVLTQLLSYCLDVGYINNLMARFWLAPLTGIRLSRILLGETHAGGFTSEFGRTAELSGRHEFSYFWQYWLKKSCVEDFLLVNEGEDTVDWEGFRRVMFNMQQAFGKAMVFKNIIGANHLARLTEVLGKVLWIYIEREPLASAVSIYNARQQVNVDPSLWWSTYPPEYEMLKHRSVYEQIAGQVVGLRQMYEQQLDTVKPEYVIRLSYEDVCANPSAVLAQTVERVMERFDYEIPVRDEVPESFPVSRPDQAAPECQRLKAALQEVSTGM